MSFSRWGYNFEGAWKDPDNLKSQSGVYVIWCVIGEKWTVLDVGESHDVKDRVINHDRAECWKRNCKGIIYYSATYTPNKQQNGRKEVEQDIRSQTNPPCGER